MTVTDTAGYVHQFHATGELDTVTAPIDSLSPAAPTPDWTTWTPTGSTPAQRLTSQTDPVSGRQVLYTYQSLGTCPTAAGFTTPSPGMLCKITYPDGTTTDLLYQALTNGERVLSRVVDPGNEIYDIGYTNVNLNGSTVPMISTFRDPFINDLMAYPASGVTAATDYQTLITYDTKARGQTVTGPKAATTATGRQKATAQYQDVAGVTVNETWVLIDGLDNPGSSIDWDRKVFFDDTARIELDLQALNAASTQFSSTETRWHPSMDRPEVSISDGFATTNIYNYRNELTATYGPARTACFNLTTTSPSYKQPNGTCTTPQVPYTSTEYDTRLNTDGTTTPWTGLGTSWWNNNTGAGKPNNRTTGLGGTATTLAYDWGASSPAATTANDFSFRSDGEIWFPATGNWGFEIVANTDDVASVTIDGQQVAFKNTGATTATGIYTVTNDANLKSGTSHIRRIAVQFLDTSGNAKLTINWTPPAGTKTAVPLSALRPAYSLATRITTHDNGGDAPTHSTHISYDTGGLDPAVGLVSQTVEDPAGLKLTHTNTYEPGTYRRRLTRTLPAGNTYTYQYYTATGAGSNASTNVACTSQDDTTVNQGAMVRITVSPPAASGASIISEKVYDQWGRTAATRPGTRTTSGDTWDAWSCTNYDTRGRVSTVSIPSNSAAPARTITNTYAAGGDPRVNSTADASGTITTTTDLLGRTVTYTGLSGMSSTSVYDPTTGRLTSSTDPAGTHSYTYDRGGRLTTQALNGEPIAQPTYWGPTDPDPHALKTVTYPGGVGNAGNGTTGTISRDSNGRTTSLAWNVTGGPSITTDSVVRSRSGRIIDRSIDGVDSDPTGNNFTYDTSGRLSRAHANGDIYTYGFAASGGCGSAPAAGKNANRTSININAVSVASFCYDNADRLTSVTSTTAPFNDYTGTISYDTHGNTTTLAGQQLIYDAADRHIATHTPNATSPTSSVVYQRDVFDRIIARTETVNGIVTVTRYGFTGTGDSPNVVMDATGTVIETLLSLPGGVLVTLAAGSEVWSYPDIHGSITATANDAGTKQGPTRTYDPDGNPLAGIPNNADGNFDFGWLGQHQRGLDHTTGLQPIIQMGARPYDPLIARFLEVDPIEGGNTNDYDYCSGNPINCTDLDGRIGFSIGPIKVGDGCPLGKNPNGSCRGADAVRQTGRLLQDYGPLVLAVSAVVCTACAVVAAGYSLYQTARECARGVATAACGISAVSSVLAATGAGFAVRASRAAKAADRVADTASAIGGRSATLNRTARVALNRSRALTRAKWQSSLASWNFDGFAYHLPRSGNRGNRAM